MKSSQKATPAASQNITGVDNASSTGPRGNSKVNIYTYIHNGPESNLDKRYDYQWEILRTALEKTRDEYGPFILKPSVFMTEKRQSDELRKATGNITVMYLGASPQLEEELIPVRIPVDKNLAGYMVYLIRKEDQSKFDSVETLDDLRKFTIGQGEGWIDIEILKANKFKVVTGSSYDGLFEMLVHKRFDAFQRSVVEVHDEYDQRKAAMPDLHIERNILLYYPWPMYFWFSKTDGGRAQAERARKGMLKMIDDGTYDEIFLKYHKHKIDELDLKHRKIFRLDNHLLSPETPLGDKRLWFDPLAQ